MIWELFSSPILCNKEKKRFSKQTALQTSLLSLLEKYTAD